VYRETLDLLAEEPMVLLAAVLAVGALLGSVSVRGVAIGPAGALFAGLTASALDDRLVIPGIVGTVGLSLFTYCVGLAAGPELQRAWRASLPLLVAVVLVLGGLAVVAGGIGALLDLPRAQVAGAYAGALTNTPALAAARSLLPTDEQGAPVVGYALTYPFGVIGMLAAVVLASRSPAGTPAAGTSVHLQSLSVRVGAGRGQSVTALEGRFASRVRVSRVQRGDRVWVPGPIDILQPGDVIAVTCPVAEADAIVAALGDRAPAQLTDDRTRLDFRRMVVSNNDLVGRPLSDLQLTARHGATITRVRRGAVDMLAHNDLVLEPGDRVRVVAPPERMPLIARELGDDERHVAEFHPRGFTVGLLLGLLAGLVPVPMPGVGTVELGSAGGPLLVGLFLGWRERTGPFVWQTSRTVSFTIRQLGSLLFLGMAGTSGGAALRAAVTGGDALRPFVTGLALTGLAAASILLVARRRRLPAGEAAGLLAGAQTQPAVLAFAMERLGDPRLDLTYALVLPAAMVTKIVAAQVLLLV
jgi:putative transport protein